MDLRPYQLESIERVRQSLRGGKRRIIIVAPTGAGKTVIAADIVKSAQAKGKRVLFLAHRRELIQQCSKKLDDFGVDHGIIQADHPRRRPSAMVHVASVPTLVRRLEGRRQEADIVIIDECHRALADSYTRIIEAYPKAVILGLTATPWRTDGKGLGRIYEDMVVVSTVRQLVGQGYLIDPVFYSQGKIDLKNLELRGGDYSEDQLAALIDTKVLVGNIVGHWKKLAGDARTVVFAVNVAHSRHIVECFRAAGVAAEHLDGETPQSERDDILSRLRSGATSVVSNCQVLTEGWDLPELGCAILARPTMSQGLYMQMVGRVMRRVDGVKEKALVLDHAQCVKSHGFPSDPMDYSLEDSKRVVVGEMAERKLAKECPQCGADVPLGVMVCPAPGCGYVFPAVVVPRETAEELQLASRDARPRCGKCSSVQVKEIRSAKLGAYTYGLKCKSCDAVEWLTDRAAAKACGVHEKLAEYNRLVKTQGEKGLKPGWVSFKFRELFGSWPKSALGELINEDRLASSASISDGADGEY